MAYNYEFIDRKRKTIPELAAILEKLRAQGKVIMHCHGVFDLLHPGHIHQFLQAKARGDILVVTITRDQYAAKGSGRPYLNESLRLMSIAAQEVVDFVVLSERPTAVECIRAIKPNYFVKGEEFRNPAASENSPISLEVAAVKESGGEMFFTDMLDVHSTEILNEFFPVFPPETAEFLRRLKGQYNIDLVARYISSIRNLRVLLIGETIIDSYRYMRLIGKSPKAGIIAKLFLSQEFFLGGILAAANHIANFCDRVEVVSLLGQQDSKESFIRSGFCHNITAKFFYHPESSTIVKERDIDSAYFYKLGETYFYDNKPLPPEVEDDIEEYLRHHLHNFDLVLVMDFGHRFFTPKLIRVIREKAKFLALNTQMNAANFGFNVITKWPGADFIVLDEKELRLAVHNEHEDVENLITDLKNSRENFFQTIATPRGSRGSIIFNPNQGFKNAPAFSTKVIDLVGAGTAYMAITAPLAAKNVPIELICFIGNAAGAMNVSVLANKKLIEYGPLMKFLAALLK